MKGKIMWLPPENTMHYIALNILLQLSISLKSFRNILFYSKKLKVIIFENIFSIYLLKSLKIGVYK